MATTLNPPLKNLEKPARRALHGAAGSGTARSLGQLPTDYGLHAEPSRPTGEADRLWRMIHALESGEAG